MTEIGGRPILWHIMKIYSHYGVNEFVILLGYKGYQVKEYFANYFLHQSDVTIDLSENRVEVHSSTSEPWRVTLVDTGQQTMTGGRILRAKRYVENSSFHLTYGDGVSDVDISALEAFHQNQQATVTLTSVRPEPRFGSILRNPDGKVARFTEKPAGDGHWINGGFFVCEPPVFDYLPDDACVFEDKPLEQLAQAGKLSAYCHEGFWKPMDTLRDKNQLNELWKSGRAAWKRWTD